MEVLAEETVLNDENDNFSELEKLRIANRVAQQLLVENTKLLSDDVDTSKRAEASSEWHGKRNAESSHQQTQKEEDKIGGNNANDNWGVKEYLQNDNFKYVQDYLRRIDHLLTMSDSVKQVALPSNYETVSTTEELLQKSENKKASESTEQRKAKPRQEADDNICKRDRSVSTEKRDKPKPMINNFVISPTSKSGSNSEAKQSGGLAEAHNENLAAKQLKNLELHTHRPSDSQFHEFVATRRERTESSKQQTSKSVQKERGTTQKVNGEFSFNSEEPAVISEKNSFSQLSKKIYEDINQKECFENENNEVSRTATSPKPLHKSETKQNLDKDSFALTATSDDKIHEIPVLEQESFPIFTRTDKTIDSKLTENHTLKTKGEVAEELRQVAVPKLNLSDFDGDDDVDLVTIELKTEVNKPLHVATEVLCDVENRQGKKVPLQISKKASVKPDLNAISGKSAAEFRTKRPTTAGKRDKTVSTNAQRKWGKSCIAWSSYGNNQLRTWSSIQLPKKKLPSPEKRLQVSKPVVTTLTKRLLPKFENSWLSLPEEVLLHIFCFLSIHDLFTVAKVCKTFERISQDFHLWKFVKVADLKLSDEWLAALGNRSPQTLSLTGCNGGAVTNVGLRTFFRSCKTSLTDLHVENCTGSQLSGDAVLLHASCHCRNLTHVNVAWSRTTENGIIAIALACTKLLSLNINGNSAIGEEAFEVLTRKHAHHLESLEMSGCFGVPCETLLSLLKATTSLHALNIGLCGKIPTESIIDICPSLTCLKHFDLRGVKSVTNQCLHAITTQCKNLETLIISNCSQITDVGISEIATYRNSLIHLDISGCSLVSDQGIVNFLMAAKSIEHLDLSDTGATHVTVDFIACHNFGTIKTLKLSFCHNITLKSLLDLLNVAVTLKSLHLYGCKRIKLSQLMRVGKGVLIEK